MRGRYAAGDALQLACVLALCPTGSEVSADNASGLVLDAFLLASLWLLWQPSTWWNLSVVRCSLSHCLCMKLALTLFVCELSFSCPDSAVPAAWSAMGLDPCWTVTGPVLSA